MTVEWFMRRGNNRWLGLKRITQNMQEKWRLEHLGALGIMGQMVPGEGFIVHVWKLGKKTWILRIALFSFLNTTVLTHPKSYTVFFIDVASIDRPVRI